MENRFFRHVLTGVLLFGIILLSFWIRIQGAAELPAGQFTEHDAYLYHWQAGIIAEQGHLPERDMHRWLPIGRDNTQLLPLYAYAYDFFIGVPLAFFTATFIEIITSYLFSATGEKKNEKKQHINTESRKTIAACLILLSFMFLPPLGAYATRSIYAATQMRKPTPGDAKITNAFHWIKTELPPSSVVAAKWDYGTQLNVFGRVKTITDPDIYISNWINLYAQYVERAKSERACLEFLKTHSATHLMLTRKDFATPSFLNRKSTEVFLPVYPAENFFGAPVKIWEIRYPLDIKPNPKYLATQQKGDPLGRKR